MLQAKDTIDKKIYNCLQRKGNAVDELYMEMGMKKKLKERKEWNVYAKI